MRTLGVEATQVPGSCKNKGPEEGWSCVSKDSRGGQCAQSGAGTEEPGERGRGALSLTPSQATVRMKQTCTF